MTNNLTLSQIRSLLTDRRLLVVAKRTSLNYSTLKNIVNGKNNNPTMDTIEKLSRYFAR